jgi:hypothetical protein
MASDVADLDASQASTNAPSSFEPVAEPATIDGAAYRQDMACDVFRALVHGMRIEVKPTDIPCDIAERTLKLHAELMKHAELAGIIPAEPAE